MMRQIKTYVIRGGRMSPRQQGAYDDFLADYRLDLTAGPWDLAAIFGNTHPVVVEVGFGMGASLVEMATANPAVNYIGIEVHKAGIGSLVAALHALGLNNVRVVEGDAVAVFETALGERSIAGIQVFFPDPWHKKRHHKRRLIQEKKVDRLIDCLQIGGFIHCATDWEAYAQQMAAVLSAEQRLINRAIDGLFIPRPLDRPLTKFEQRGLRLGHQVYDLFFVKQTPCSLLA